MRRWINAHRIGVAAFCLREFSASNFCETVQDSLEQELASCKEFYAGEKIDYLSTLPPTALNLLRRVEKLESWTGSPGLKRRVDAALDALFSRRESLIGRCNIFAHHVFHSGVPARTINTIARDLFEIPVGARISVGAEPEQLHSALTTLRNVDSATVSQLGAVLQLVTSLSIRDCVKAAQIENVLCQHLFAWPLLVFERSNLDVAVSVPVAVDARFDSAKPDGIHVGHRAFVCGAGLVDINRKDDYGWEFASYLAKATERGRALWLSTHGHTGQWRDRVLNVPLIFDFQFASAVVDGIFKTLTLKDRSAGAYFAQVVLARLLGRSPSLSSLMTGAIGDHAEYRDGTTNTLDHMVDGVQGGAEKFQFAREAGMWERIVIPSDHDQNLHAALTEVHGSGGDPTNPRIPKLIEVRRAATGSTAADICQVLGWRRYHYVRCPEVGWAIHSRKVRRDAQGAQSGKDLRDFEIVHAALSGNSQSVIPLEGASPVAVASYLWHINRVVLPDLCQSRPDQRRPPGLSWAFIRTEDYEQDADFWHVLWRIVGASQEAFEEFRCCPTRAGGVEDLARMLNIFEPTEEAKSHRAPDVIVIIGPEKFDSASDIRVPAQRPLAVAPILNALRSANLLRLCPSRQRDSDFFSIFDRWIGRTRIILLPEPASAETPQHPLPISSDDLSTLDRLQIFRRSFTQHMAAPLLRDLGKTGQLVRETLDGLERREWLRRFGADYYIPGHVQADIESRPAMQQVQPLTRAERHFLAGTALAPYCMAGEFSSLALDAAMLPERAHEAYEHFSEARRLFESLGQAAAAEKEIADAAFRTLSCYGPSPSLGGAIGLVQRKGQRTQSAYMFIEEYLAGWQNHPRNRGKVPNHPTHVALAAKALRFVTPSKALQQQYGHVLDDRPATIRQMFKRALDCCEGFPEEGSYSRLRVLSEYAEYLYDQYVKGDRRVAGEIKSIDRQILDLRASWAICQGAILGSWFDVRGDLCSDHFEASAIYIDGIQVCGPYQQLKVKAIGALALAKVEHPLSAELASLSEKDAHAVVDKGIAAYRRESKNWQDRRQQPALSQLVGQWDLVIAPRWNAGIEAMRKLWQQYPDCIAKLNAVGQGHGSSQGSKRKPRRVR